MRKHLLIAAILALAAPAVFASLPTRATKSAMKTIVPVFERTLALQKPVPNRVKANVAENNVVTVPFLHTLGKGSEVADYTVIDANGDGTGWKPGGFTAHSVCMTNSLATQDADDWLISVPVKLEAGKYYKLSFEAGMTLNRTEDLMEVRLGTDATVESMTTELMPVYSIPCNDKAFIKQEQQFGVAADGEYYIGFHVVTKAGQGGTVKLCNFGIEECEAPVVLPENTIEVPFSHTLGKNTEVKDYTVIDGDGDGTEWKPGGFSDSSAIMTSKATNDCDDWLISVPVKLEAGKDYTLSFDSYMNFEKIEDLMEVRLGSDVTPEAMTTELVPVFSIKYNNKKAETKTQTFTVDATGAYYFGFHAVSKAGQGGVLRLSNFSVVESSTVVEPAAAGTLSVEMASKGELAATVTYVAPTLTASGKPLEKISKVVLTTNWAYKQEITDVQPGQTLTFQTTDIFNGPNNRFEAVAYVGETIGEPALLTGLYAGYDNPQPLQNLKVRLSDDYKHVTFSWDAPTEVGENGGYVDVDDVTYYIFDAFGSYYDPAIAMTKGTSYTFDYSDIDGQDFVAYQVTASFQDDYYISSASTSDIVIVGQPETLPFVDSFTDGNYAQMWAVDPDSQGDFMNGTLWDNELQTNADADEGVEPEYLNSQDADNGFFLFLPYQKDATYGFFSTKIDISGAANPVFEFFYQGKGSVLDAKLAVDGKPFEVVKSLNLKENPTDEWALCRIDLAPYKNARYIQIGVMVSAVHNTADQTWSVPFDNIRVIDLKDQDARISYLCIPANVKAGENAPAYLVVENIGTSPLSGAGVTLAVDGEEIATATLPDFGSGKIAMAEFEVPSSLLSPDMLSVKFAATVPGKDEQLTAAGDIAVLFPEYPAPAGLTAVADNGNVTLSWDAIDMAALTAPATRVEDFENPAYEHFTISDFGGFHFVDGDGRATYRFLDDVLNPYRTQPQAYQLFTPSESGIPEEQYLDADPHSGKSMLVAWSCDRVNDNWLISPALSGAAQTLSFWAKSFTSGYPESFEVLVSYTDAETTSFELLTTVDEAAETWTEYTVALPEGAEYFAIRHTSYDTYALYLDDFTFDEAGVVPSDATLEGYNVYCDGVKLNDAPVAEASYSHEGSGVLTFRVSAVYSVGESRPCEALTVDTATGIATVEAEAGEAEYFNLQGIRVDNPTEGIYIRRQDGKATKVLVK